MIRLIIVICLFVVPIVTGCTEQKPEYEGKFKAYENHGVITAVNKRLPFDEDPALPACDIAGEAAAQKVFLECVRNRGSYEGGFCLLEIDATALDAAIMLARFRRKIDASAVPVIRASARTKLLKSGARSFLLVHNSKGVYALGELEPRLISQSRGIGRLVGMSVTAGVGLKAGDVGFLMFEDKVSANDASFAVRVDLTFADEAEGLGKSRGLLQGGRKTQKLFTFSGEASAVSMLKDAFSLHLPAPTAPPQAESSGISTQDAAVIAELAMRLVRFLSKS